MTEENRVAVVTGSAGGLGRAIAQRLAQNGFKVMLHDINKDLLSKTVKEFEQEGFNAAYFVGDVSKKADQEKLVKTTVEKFGHLDVFINNAGVEAVGPFLKIGEDELQKLFNVNVFGTVYGTQAAAEQFIRQDTKGKIINACSIAGHEAYAMLGTYSATKHAVRAFTQVAAKELAAKHVTVNAYCPGVAKTKMWNRIDEEMVKADPSLKPGEAFDKYASEIALGRYEKPRDVANLVKFLASEDSDYITGQAILVDGGLVYR
ncbi:acetoin reductase [Liquorilactobacillus oeni]|uniref:diacetyl reductase [(S)-acetoin forming] n=1 Tax=Liquorilactobacillus oeni DSM 19972 TaxID=1423777 RepID=A0A0R1MAK0_9LACO|nr:acetoin reductase [Liquorilactobacillus oeni]KRL05116.1 3-oxoacyl-ACP reductase [Liquorilactobacillus oeni DSM 19972]